MSALAMRRLRLPFLLLASCLAAGALTADGPARAADTVSLAGRWRFALDRGDAGVRERWFDRSLDKSIDLPGSLPGQGIGDDVTVSTPWTGGIVDRSWFTAPEFEKYRKPGNVKVPFWLQPEKYYAGAAWYQREIEIPAAWQGRRVVLFLERPHWETRVWIDNQPVGVCNALGTPHEHDLGPRLAPGPHRLTIRVDNRLVVDVGHDSHSVSDHTQGNWNGIVGRIEILATPPVWLDDLQVFPHVATRSITVKGRIGNAAAAAGKGSVTLRVGDTNGTDSGPLCEKRVEAAWSAEGGSFQAEVPLGPGAQLWDEFQPALYTLTATLDEGGSVKSTTFGLREISTRGTQFLINGRKTFFRGTLECAIFPRSGHPPTDIESWKRILQTCRAHGLNNMRFHSWCPPEAAFAAADQLGYYFHVECSSWANSSTTLGDGKPVDAWLYQEADRMLRYYGNHPSFVLMPYGNEPGGAKHAQYLAQWVSHYRAEDPRRLYTAGSGWPQLPENQFHVAPDPRVQGWGEGLRSRINAKPPETGTDYRAYIAARKVPVISHEIGQWCVYPNFDEMAKYQGYLKPRNFEIFRDRLVANHMGDLARPFLLASGKLQALCYKEDIESALRTPGMGGFQLLDLHDFPGQGTALVGVLDPFWEQKGYVTPEEYSRFCNATVPLARLAKRVFTAKETLEADLEVAHFGPAPLAGAVAWWELTGDDGKPMHRGKLPPKTIPVDNGVALGSLRTDLLDVPAPGRYRLRVGLEGTRFENDWDVWVYPAEADVSVPAGVTVATDLDQRALAALEAGGKVVLMVPPSRVAGDKLGKVALGFSSIFWNTAWTRRQPPHTLGILCDPKHPLFAQFPTDYHSNWQWWYLVTRAGAMILDGLPVELRPTVRVIDDWFTARRLGLVFEARLGKGSLLVTSIDLEHDLDSNPVARQFRQCLLRYAAGPDFAPKHAVTAEQVRALMSPPSPMQRLGARIARCDSAEEGYDAGRAIDGDPGTLWHTAWTGGKPGFPHELVIEFKTPANLAAVTLLPRQDHNRNGWIKDYAIYVSEDGRTWGDPVVKGSLPGNDQLHRIPFPRPTHARFLRLAALSGHADGPWASLAEVNVEEATKP